MKASEVIKKLQDCKKQFGDKEVELLIYENASIGFVIKEIDSDKDIPHIVLWGKAIGEIRGQAIISIEADGKSY